MFTERRRPVATLTAAGTAIALLVAGCGSSTHTASSSPASTAAGATSGGTSSASQPIPVRLDSAPGGAPVVFHAVVSETGAASFLGSREAKALNVVAQQVNSTGGIDGHPMKVEIQDNQSNPATAVQLAQPWISQGVQFILNGSVVASDKAVDALATSSGPFIYDLSPGTHPKPGSMIFSSGISTKSDAAAYLNFLASKGMTRVAIMNSTDGSGVDGYSAFTAALSTKAFSKFKMVSHQTFDPTSVSVNTQLAKIKAARPQALIVWTTGTPLGVVLQGMASLGMDSIPTVTTDGNAAYAELTKFSSLLPKKIFFPTGALYVPPSDLKGSLRASVASFDKAVAAVHGHGGDPWGLSYEPALLLVGALKHLGIHATAKQILNYMQHLHNVAGIYGSYSTSIKDHRGVHTNSIYMSTWNGSSFIPVSGPGGRAAGTPKS